MDIYSADKHGGSAIKNIFRVSATALYREEHFVPGDWSSPPQFLREHRAAVQERAG